MVFCFVQNFFFGQHESSNINFFCCAKREIFFQNSTSGYMSKTLNQIIFFFLDQNQNIFFSNIGNQNIFLEISIPPTPFKLNGRSLTHSLEEGRWFSPGTLGTKNKTDRPDITEILLNVALNAMTIILSFLFCLLFFYETNWDMNYNLFSS